MEKIILASNNIHKIKEFKTMFKGYEVLSMEEIGFVEDIEENGKTFFENALIKAKALIKYMNENNIEGCAVADDSGLCVNALNGEPGVYSARYAGQHDHEANRQKILKNLIKKNDRSAYFECCLVKMNKNGTYITATGKTFGTITKEYIGKTDFGYDCLFLSDDLNKTFAVASDEEKNSVSHRGRALKQLLEIWK